MYLVVGLGNPGEEYEITRHNIGFMVIDSLCDALGVKLAKRKFNARWKEAEVDEVKVILAKPQTFVNASGESVKPLLNFLKLSPSNLLVVHDDLDLLLGEIRFKDGGGSGGHNGIRSIISSLGDGSFKRLKVGIGRPKGKQSPKDFVLTPFTKKEWEELEFAIPKAKEAVIAVIESGFKKAMSLYNNKK